MATYWEITAHSAYDMFSLYEGRSEKYKLHNIYSKTKRELQHAVETKMMH